MLLQKSGDFRRIARARERHLIVQSEPPREFAQLLEERPGTDNGQTRSHSARAKQRECFEQNIHALLLHQASDENQIPAFACRAWDSEDGWVVWIRNDNRRRHKSTRHGLAYRHTLHAGNDGVLETKIEVEAARRSKRVGTLMRN